MDSKIFKSIVIENDNLPIVIEFCYLMKSKELILLNQKGYDFFKISPLSHLKGFHLFNRIFKSDLENIQIILAKKELKEFCLVVRVLSGLNIWEWMFVSIKVVESKAEGTIAMGIAQIISSEIINKIPLDTDETKVCQSAILKALTSREKMILKLLCSGLKNQEIADQLNLSVQTIQTHRKNINKKLNIRTPAELHKYL